MTDESSVIEPSYVTVVNRLPETRDFMGFGRVHVFKPGEERAVSQAFAEWIFTRTDGPMLAHTNRGYVHWLGIKDGPDELVARLPDTVFDCSPLTAVASAEGWDTSVVDRDPAHTQVKQVPLVRADFEHQGRAGVKVDAPPARVLKEK